ncbi:MAG: esterase-like activity of phytase family protein, partial [Bdellovibrio sp.]
HTTGHVSSTGQKQFLVLEQNGKVGSESLRKIYKITLQKPSQNVKKVLYADLSQTSLKDFEKVEGLTVVKEGLLAIVTDNDFGINGVPDKKTGLIPLKKELSQLGLIQLSKESLSVK